MSGTRAISTTSRRGLSLFFFFLQDKAPKEIQAILTETLDCFLPGWTNKLSAPLCIYLHEINMTSPAPVFTDLTKYPTLLPAALLRPMSQIMYWKFIDVCNYGSQSADFHKTHHH